MSLDEPGSGACDLRLPLLAVIPSAIVTVVAAFSQAGGAVDLVVTDLLLPGGMGGQEIVRRLHEQRPDLRVLFVTGYGADAVEGLSGGWATLLSKPIPRSGWSGRYGVRSAARPEASGVGREGRLVRRSVPR